MKKTKPPITQELLMRLMPKYRKEFAEFQRINGTARVIPPALCNYLEMDEYKTAMCVAEGMSKTGDPRFNPPEDEENLENKLLWMALYWLTQRGAKFEHLWFQDDLFADLKFEDGFQGTNVKFVLHDEPIWASIDVARSYVRRHGIKVGSELEDIWEQWYQEELDGEVLH